MKKNIFIVCTLLLVGVLVACSTSQSSSFSRSRGTNSSATSGSTIGSAATTELSLESKIGIGILKLEGTDQAVDEAKAKELLPLFKALKTLSTNNNTAVDEISALNKQIKNTMSADQLTAIQNLNITSTDIRTLMETNGLMNANSTGSSSSSSSQGGFGGPGGPPDAAMMVVMSGQSGSGTSITKATPNAAAAMNTSRKTAGGMNLTFAEPVIKLLEGKISK